MIGGRRRLTCRAAWRRPTSAALEGRRWHLSGGVDAVGHRIVHGGTLFQAPVLIDAARAAAAGGADRPGAAAPAEVARGAGRGAARCCPACPPWPASTPRSTPPSRTHAATYALPAEWRQRWALRRYGFHGLSHAYVSRRAAALLGPLGAASRIVSCHLGAGASLCRRPRRPVGGHHDGVHAARRAGDGDQVRRRSTRAWCCGSNSTPGCPGRARRDAGVPVRAAGPGRDGRHAVRSCHGQPPATPARCSRARFTCTGSAAASRPWPPPSAAWTPWRSPAASARTPPRSAHAPWTDWVPRGAGRCRAQRLRNRRQGNRIIGRSGAQPGDQRREDIEITRQVRSVLTSI